MKFAYFVTPHIGGTYTVFRHLRTGLAAHGIVLEWMGMAQGCMPPRQIPADEWQTGRLVEAKHTESDRRTAGALLAAIDDGGYQGVFINVLADQLQMNIARYLPRRLLRIMIVHNITPGTYAAARAIRDYVHATVGVSDRCRTDLIGRFGFPADRTLAIGNAVETATLSGLRRTARPDTGMRLLYLGRVEDAAKGVFWLPDIFARLPSSATLTVAGDGPDLAALTRKFANVSRVRMLGAVSAGAVPGLLARHDVLIMPSRYEGFPLSLLEAMAVGCVPVVSRIPGVTDRIVEHGADGLLFPVGAWREASRQIEMLCQQPQLLSAMSQRASQSAGENFGIDRMADSYARLIRRLAHDPPDVPAPLPMGDWAFPAGMRPGLRQYLPRPVKNWLRVAIERM